METTYLKQHEFAEIATARKKKMLYRRLSVFFIFALFISYLMVSNFFSQSSLINTKIAQKQNYNKQLDSLKSQQASLKDDIAKLNNDDYVAKYARKEYFLSNKGEVIFNIPDGNRVNQP